MAFDNYAAQDIVPLKVLTLELTDLRSPSGGHPTVHLVHAGVGNDAYENATILDARGAMLEHEKIDDKDLSPEQQAARDKAAELRTRKRLAAHVVKQITNVQDRDAKGAISDVLDGGNPERIMEFMLAIPWFVVRKILLFAINESRWQSDEMPAVPATVLAGK